MKSKAVVSAILALSLTAGGFAFGQGYGGRNDSGAASAVQAPIISSTGVTACRLNTATGSMWSMTGGVTACRPHPGATTGFKAAVTICW